MNRIILIIFLANFIYGCSGILDKPLLDQMSEANYWKSPADLELYVNQFYTVFGGKKAFFSLDNNSDNLQPISPSEVLNGTRSVPATGGGWNWSNIREINYFLVNAAKVTEGSIADLKQYKGEGHFFRAYFYYQKVKRFGAVPWYDKALATDSKGLYAPREPRNEVIDNIISDLDTAIAYLKRKDELPAGRLNRACALLFKSRVCLYEGTWEKYHAGDPFGVKGSNGEQYLKLATAAAKQVMDDGRFSLYSTGDPKNDYYKLFSQNDQSNNPEVILCQVVDPSLGLGGHVWTYLNGFRGNRTGITQQLVADYLCIDGLPIGISEVYQGDTTLLQVVKNRDPRLEQTMWIPGQVQLDKNPPVIFDHPSLDKGSYDMATTGYMIRKGSTTDPEQNQGAATAQYGKLDGVVFRYAEVLLNYAESKAELGTLSQEDLDRSINLLRKRVGMPQLNINVGYIDPNWDFPELDPIINEIRRARRVELALEGFRYDDLMRWAASDLIQGTRWRGARFIKNKSFPDIEDKISAIPVDKDNYIDRYRNSVPHGFGFDKNRDYLYPIPTNELTLNKNLTQNPGWE